MLIFLISHIYLWFLLKLFMPFKEWLWQRSGLSSSCAFALSHCPKCLSGFLHWVTVQNVCRVFYIEPLSKMFVGFSTLSHCPKCLSGFLHWVTVQNVCRVFYIESLSKIFVGTKPDKHFGQWLHVNLRNRLVWKCKRYFYKIEKKLRLIMRNRQSYKTQKEIIKFRYRLRCRMCATMDTFRWATIWTS